jgi:hypothetical protein
LADERSDRSTPEIRIIKGTLITRSSTRDRRTAHRLREATPA